MMIYREAKIEDVPQIMKVRHSVKENVSQNPDAITVEDCEDYLIKRGKGWVCEVDDRIVGFGIVDLQENNVWALFMHPDFEKRGIGKRIHDTMVNWYFSQKEGPLWLGTDPGTRAEMFYRKNGWQEIGVHGEGEVKFEMRLENWESIKMQ